MSRSSWLDRAVSQGLLRSFDKHFALLMGELGGGGEPLMLAAALLSRATGEGHVCLPLAGIAGEQPFAEAGITLAAPGLTEWRMTLTSSKVVAAPGGFAPLILDASDRLYLGRYWHYENDLAQALLARARQPSDGPDQAAITPALTAFFPPTEEIDWQKAAAALALSRPFSVISGGPGTGKTWTAAVILALCQRLAPRSLRMVLAAPTGKAAARLAESIRLAKANLPLESAERERIPDQATTLHRLLGARPGGNFRHGPDDPLHLDLLLVDEASMVDLPLMARLVSALPTRARLILLGDRDQLASVEAGYVLGDICGPHDPPPLSAATQTWLGEACGHPLPEMLPDTAPLADTVILLRKSRRFASVGPIARFATAVRDGDATTAAALLNGGLPWTEDGPERLTERATARYADYLKADTPQEALAGLERFRVLCALREGPFGVGHLNALIEQGLARLGLIAPNSPLYAGRPVMVTRNDHGLGLFNGDVGLLWPDAEGRLRAWFPAGNEEGVRAYPPSRLPEHETVYAMTVHKSQGSEFDEVLLALPDEDSPLLSRELLYTAVTRARQRVELRVGQEILGRIVERRVRRESALRERLWEKGADH